MRWRPLACSIRTRPQSRSAFSLTIDASRILTGALFHVAFWQNSEIQGSNSCLLLRLSVAIQIAKQHTFTISLTFHSTEKQLGATISEWHLSVGRTPQSTQTRTSHEKRKKQIYWEVSQHLHNSVAWIQRQSNWLVLPNFPISSCLHEGWVVLLSFSPCLLSLIDRTRLATCPLFIGDPRKSCSPNSVFFSSDFALTTSHLLFCCQILAKVPCFASWATLTKTNWSHYRQPNAHLLFVIIKWRVLSLLCN